MKSFHKLGLVITLIVILILGGCSTTPLRPEGTVTPKELLKDPVYDIEVRLAGQVSLLGELLCPCFRVSAGGDELEVWYDLMVEDDGAELSPVSVEGIENGDWVVVTGKLKPGGVYHARNNFWASEIELIE
ncbi:MAG: hypothetical protein PVF83_01795 [Anaerolineales bacterium]|jgi:hypothetical protein